MDDDDDRSVAAILHRLAGALLHVEGKAQMLEHRGARHLLLQLFQFLLFHLARAPCRAPVLFPPHTSGQEPEAAKSKAGKGAAGKPA
jgi:hypothetical protein